MDSQYGHTARSMRMRVVGSVNLIVAGLFSSVLRATMGKVLPHSGFLHFHIFSVSSLKIGKAIVLLSSAVLQVFLVVSVLVVLLFVGSS